MVQPQLQFLQKCKYLKVPRDEEQSLSMMKILLKMKNQKVELRLVSPWLYLLMSSLSVLLAQVIPSGSSDGGTSAYIFIENEWYWGNIVLLVLSWLNCFVLPTGFLILIWPLFFKLSMNMLLCESEICIFFSWFTKPWDSWWAQGSFCF